MVSVSNCDLLISFTWKPLVICSYYYLNREVLNVKMQNIWLQYLCFRYYSALCEYNDSCILK